MIEERKLAEICEKYKMNCEELIKTNPNILIYGNEQDIIYVLNFLKEELNIDGKNIEKCPSILYFGIDNIKHNYKFLKDKEIRNYDVETCLHILSAEPKDLEATYNYIFKNYGVDYLNQITSILNVKEERIIDIETNCKELEKMQVLRAAISRRSIEEIKQIVKVCKANGIEPTGNVFRQTAEEVEKIVEVCKTNGIEPTGNVFFRTAEEIEQIVEVCKAKGIEPTGNVFLRTAEEIEKLVEVCKAKGIEPTGTIFMKTAEEIGKLVEVCKAKGIEPTGNVFRRTAEEIEQIVEVYKANDIEPTGTVFQRTAEEIEKIVEVCNKNGIKPTGTVFIRTAEEIEKIVEVCNKNGIELTGSVFMKTVEEIEKIAEVCNKNDIELTGTIFMKTAEEIEKIVKVCKTNGIEPTGSVFMKTAEEIEKIVEVCKKNGIEITGSIFVKSASKLEECIEYVRKDFGEKYLLPLIVSKNIKTLEKVLPYLKEKGYLEYIKGSASILSLTLEQIKEREKFIEEQGESIIDERGKFNSIFGMSKKNYEKRAGKTQEKNESSRKKDSKSIARAVKDVPITKVREAQSVLNEITNENELEDVENND